MKENSSNDKLLLQKILFTFLIILEYMIGRCIPLFGVDRSAYSAVQISMDSLLTQSISGDINKISVLSLGISPYMISSLLVQMAMIFRSSEAKAKVSPKKTGYVSLAAMFVLAIVLAVKNVGVLRFAVADEMLIIAKAIAVIEMVVGAYAILWLSERNKKYGIGGQTALILVNVIDGMASTLKGHTTQELWVPLLVSLVIMVIVIIMENTEKRISVQRISIHNIYADKNYLAIKLNPIGIMPVMFSTAFFMLPQMLLFLLQLLFPENETIAQWKDALALTNFYGIIVYLAILFLLTIGFSMIFVNPRDITESFLKSGDSIINIHAGRETRRYIGRTVFFISLISAVVMCVCLGVPLFLQLNGNLDNSLVMFPSSVMMLTGIWCNLYQEIRSIRNQEAYESII